MSQTLDYVVPVGLSFAHLKGSVALLDRILEEERPYHEVHYARVQLYGALDLFRSSIEKNGQGNLLTHRYERLSRELIKDSHTMFEIAASRLSSALKPV